MNFEPTSDEEEKPALQDAKATTPAADANAAPSARTPADPTIDDAVPMALLTRAEIHTQLDERNRVLMRLHAKLAFLKTAEATRLDKQIINTERDLALFVAKRIDTVKAARAPDATPPVRPAARAGLANESAPLSPYAGFQRFSFVNTSLRQLVFAYGMDDDECISEDRFRSLMVPRIARQGKPHSIL